MQAATYTKLRDGSWGIRIGDAEGQVRAGAEVLVRKMSGETRTETVERVVWSEARVSICSIARRQPSPARSQYGGRGYAARTGCACGSLEGKIRASDCWTCRHDSE